MKKNYPNEEPILFIAEVSANHLGSLDRAKQIVRAAAKAGANAVKFQTYTAETMTLDLPTFAISENHSLWGGRKLFDLYDEAHTPWEWHEELFALAWELEMIPFSSPFDLSAVDFLESLNAPMYKIASMETGDHRLIKAVAQTGKPIIISTGATELVEIDALVKVVQSTGNTELTLLLCTSSYPAKATDSHIRRIGTLRDRYNCKVGLSDHTLGIAVGVAAIALGATAIEKHLTLRRSDGGADGAFSMEPEEFDALVRAGKEAYSALGNSNWSIQPSEKESRNLRRTLYIVDDVEAGQEVNYENIRAIRPGGGGPAGIIDELIGRKFAKAFKKGDPMNIDCVE
jgi:pseudaminic acid synthase